MKNLPVQLLVWIVCLCCTMSVTAQSPAFKHFSISSPQNTTDQNYGKVTLEADKKPLLIQTILANGENVKGLTIRINNGVAFKLAPSQGNNILNYIGTGLHIILQPGEKAVIEFISSAKVAARQLYVSGEITD